MTKSVGALMVAAAPGMLLLAAFDLITFWEAVGVGGLFLVLGLGLIAIEAEGKKP